MFTGIVTALGEVKAVETLPGLTRLTISAPYAGADIGASISHDGVCLTVVETETHQSGMRYVVEVAPESLALTTMGSPKRSASVFRRSNRSCSLSGESTFSSRCALTTK